MTGCLSLCYFKIFVLKTPLLTISNHSPQSQQVRHSLRFHQDIKQCEYHCNYAVKQAQNQNHMYSTALICGFSHSIATKCFITGDIYCKLKLPAICNKLNNFSYFVVILTWVLFQGRSLHSKTLNPLRTSLKVI